MKKLYFFALCMLCATLAQAQFNLRGTVKDDQGAEVAGATVQISSVNKGATTDVSGNYTISGLRNGTYLVRFSYTGSQPTEQSVTIASADAVLDAVLATDVNTLGEVVISVGSRASQRTLTSTPLPIDVLSARELTSTGQLTFDKALQYRVPSFNTVNTPVNDATTLLDPYEIRNMGPSRAKRWSGATQGLPPQESEARF